MSVFQYGFDTRDGAIEALGNNSINIFQLGIAGLSCFQCGSNRRVGGRGSIFGLRHSRLRRRRYRPGRLFQPCDCALQALFCFIQFRHETA